MRKKRVWNYVGGGLLAFALVAVAAPAFGGPNAFSALSAKKTKTLIRKEVAKQVKPGPAGATGTPGAAGAPGLARAGARITGATGAPTPGTEFGGVEVTKSAAGGYCIRVPFTARSVVATPTDSSKYARAELTSVSGFGTCSASLPGYSAWVTTHLLTTQAFSDTDFMVLIN